MLKFISRIFSKDNSKNQSQKTKIQDNQDFLSPTINPINKTIPKDKYLELKEILKAGNDSLSKGNLDEAESKYREALAVNNDSVEARINLSWVLSTKNPLTEVNLEEAKNLLLKAVEMNEKNVDIHFILAQVYDKLQDSDSAIISYMTTLHLKPDFEQARNSLYMLAVQYKKYNIVIDFLQEEILAHPENVSLHFDLGNFYKEMESYSLAIENYEKYLIYNSNSSQAYNNLGAVYFKAKNPELAIKNYKKAIEVGNLDLKIDSTNQLLFTMNYIPGIPLSEYHSEAKKYGQLLNQKYEQLKFSKWNEKGEKLKIGFLSGDLKYHPVAYFIHNLLKNINKNKYEVIIYSTSSVEDDMSSELRKYVSVWNRVNNQDSIECAKKIHEDGINVLIDLAGHSHGHFGKNLHVFAMKPAPVQATWLGYFNSTGVEQIDYILLDRHCIKENEYQYMTEKVINVSDVRLNYLPPEDNVQYPTQTPAIKNGYITFGCYQSLLKINEEVLITWSEVLNRVPNSKIRIQEKSLQNEFVKNQFINELTKHNLQDRVVLVEGVDHKEYLNSYAQVDMILDTFPFTGGTTTCEALWMGIPTLTLSTDTIIGRQTASFLQELEMLDWIANTKKEYIEKSVSLSQDTEDLNHIRQTLRQKLLDSYICDGRNFTLDFEEALEKMWSKK